MSSRSDRTEPSDGALMTRAQDGDTEAFAQLYDRHATTAYRIAREICHESKCSEDVVEAAFLTIWTRRQDYRPATGPFEAWSMRIVRDRAIDSALESLPPLHAEVIALALYGELSHTEIAARLDLPQGTVKGRMRLGLEKLRKQMGTRP